MKYLSCILLALAVTVVCGNPLKRHCRRHPSPNLKLARGIRSTYNHEVGQLKAILADRNTQINKLVATAVESKSVGTLDADVQGVVGQSVQKILGGAETAMPGKQALYAAYVASFNLTAVNVEKANAAITSIVTDGNNQVIVILGGAIKGSAAAFAAAATQIKSDTTGSVESANRLLKATEDADSKVWESFYTKSLDLDMNTVKKIIVAVSAIAKTQK